MSKQDFKNRVKKAQEELSKIQKKFNVRFYAANQMLDNGEIVSIIKIGEGGGTK